MDKLTDLIDPADLTDPQICDDSARKLNKNGFIKKVSSDIYKFSVDDIEKYKFTYESTQLSIGTDTDTDTDVDAYSDTSIYAYNNAGVYAYSDITNDANEANIEAMIILTDISNTLSDIHMSLRNIVRLEILKCVIGIVVGTLLFI